MITLGSADTDRWPASTRPLEKISELDDLDDMFGGCAARPTAAAFPVDIIAPYPRADADADADMRRAMPSAAADH
ncbi:hypothetical protein [Embleya sp. NBC_00896]|uniref:hypothetical protein n=1 Tax=Embleya sp. NBC_00896 TaxID=2975961 RepID=UPI003867F09D|nr:hypothetical protein OG928_01050 [Embleya sp. NBC_00896]